MTTTELLPLILLYVHTVVWVSGRYSIVWPICLVGRCPLHWTAKWHYPLFPRRGVKEKRERNGVSLPDSMCVYACMLHVPLNCLLDGFSVWLAIAFLRCSRGVGVLPVVVLNGWSLYSPHSSPFLLSYPLAIHSLHNAMYLNIVYDGVPHAACLLLSLHHHSLPNQFSLFFTLPAYVPDDSLDRTKVLVNSHRNILITDSAHSGSKRHFSVSQFGVKSSL